jgi:alkanesulfonate monooxygenase SsuD/methylene tetrahydromethanopterin reductase-like flavin-dependent oxidoreductase (luciferase family)
MEFSIILEAQTADASPAREFQVMHECVEQAVLAERLGFDRVWAVEHHCLKWYAHMSAPETRSSPTWPARRPASASAMVSSVCRSR